VARDDPRPAAKVLAGYTPFIDRVEYALSLDVVFHLSEGRHNSEQHRAHRSRCVDVTPAQMEYPKGNAPASEILGERKHVLRRLTQPVQGCNHKCVARLARLQCDVKLRPGCSSSSTPLVDIQVVTPNACGPDFDLLSVRRLLPSRYPRVSNELYHRTPPLSHN
jgi:hypothetical protein